MNDYDFGNFICMLREKKGLTQQDVADMLGVTPAAVSKWENGSSKPRAEVLFKLADILGVKAEELMAGKFLPDEIIDAEAAKRIKARYEYINKIEPHTSARVKLKRLASATIDLLIVGTVIFTILSIVVKFTSEANVDSGIEATICVLSMFFLRPVFILLRDFAGFGRSVGKRITGLVILDQKSGKEADTKQKFLKNLTIAAFMVLVPVLVNIDGLVMLVRGQSISDSIAHTFVVEDERRKKAHKNSEESRPRESKEVESVQDQSEVSLTDVDLKEINTYVYTPRNNKKFIIGLVAVIGVIIVIAFCLAKLYFTKYDSGEIVSTDISRYEEDCANCKNASDFMPDLDSLTDYRSLFYSNKTFFYSYFMGFASDGLALFVQYDESTYELKKTELFNSYTFLDAPVFDGDYELPVTELYYENFYLKIVPDDEYVDFCACKSFAMVGFDDESKTLVYLYHYSFDLDFIAEADEDLEAEMRRFMDEVFEWKNKNSPVYLHPVD